MNSSSGLAPEEAYKLSAQQKEQSSSEFLTRLTRIYETAKKGKPPALIPPEGCAIDPAKQKEALALLVKGVDERMEGREDTPENLRPVVRNVYREIAASMGIKQVTPNTPDFEKNLDEFHRNYVVNFPIASEQESKEGFRELLQAPTQPNGYKEMAYSMTCPITGKYLMGMNFTAQPESNSVNFTYGFVMPEVRGVMGFSRDLKENMRSIASEHIQKYDTRFPGQPVIVFEKNILGEMSLRDILMDSASIDIDNPPKKGTDLSQSSIGQSLRDMVWDRLGGKIADYRYMQSSLDGLVTIKDKKDRDLVIKYLDNDVSLTEKDNKKAAQLLDTARGDKVEGCTALNLCVFPPPGVDKVNAEQLALHQKIFQGTSVIKDPDRIEDDIYYQAQMASLKEKSRDGFIPLTKIKPFGIKGVESFAEAEKLTEILLRNTTWAELQADSDKPYKEWLNEKLAAIAPELEVYKTASRTAEPFRRFLASNPLETLRSDVAPSAREHGRG